MGRVRKQKERKNKYFDYTLLTVVLFLLFIGLIMLYSVSSYDANLTFGDSAYYIKSQFRNTIIGLVIMCKVTKKIYYKQFDYAK